MILVGVLDGLIKKWLPYDNNRTGLPLGLALRYLTCLGDFWCFSSAVYHSYSYARSVAHPQRCGKMARSTLASGKVENLAEVEGLPGGDAWGSGKISPKITREGVKDVFSD